MLLAGGNTVLWMVAEGVTAVGGGQLTALAGLQCEYVGPACTQSRRRAARLIRGKEFHDRNQSGRRPAPADELIDPSLISSFRRERKNM